MPRNLKIKGTHMERLNIALDFATDDQCWTYLEKVRWPEGVRCPKCTGSKIARIARRRVFECLDPKCGHQFTVTSGTVLHDSHLPVRKWFLAAALVASGSEGLSARAMQKRLGVAYQTAWHLCHRIREAIDQARAQSGANYF